MKMKLVKIISVMLTAVMILGIAVQGYSAEDGTEKQEVIYANLLADGSMQAVYVVNIVRPDSTGLITDYGSYTGLRNMSTTEDINQDGDTITINTEEDKIYYEGTLQDAQLPWNIEISYIIDGEELSAEEIAGETGSVEIIIDITKNENADQIFFDNMTVQVSVTLDSLICANITAEGATIANSGRDKQVSYTLLPGNEKTFTIKTDAENFEMEAVVINALYTDMNIDVDESGILDEVNTLQEALEKIDEGAGELEEGVGALKDAVDDELVATLSKLNEGSSDLEDAADLLASNAGALDSAAGDLLLGADELEQGIADLDQGLALVCSGLDELSAQSGGITAGSAQIYAALIQLQQGLAAMPAIDVSGLSSASGDIMTAINQLTAAAGALNDALDYDAYNTVTSAQALKTGNSSVISQIDAQIALTSDADTIAVLESAKSALQANNAYIDATQVYFTSLETSAGSLYSGMQDLQTQYASFDSEIQTLALQLSGLSLSLSSLSDSVDALVLQYANLNDGIIAYADGVIQAQGGCSAAYAGVSELAAGSGLLTDGLEQLSSGTGQLYSGAAALKNAMSGFDDGIKDLTDGIYDLSDGVDELYSGSGELKDGTGELKDETSEMDNKITDQIDEMLSSVSGGGEVVSFVSEKNTNVSSVQFVMKTQAVEIEEPEADTEIEIEEKSFWDKLLMLFGIE